MDEMKIQTNFMKFMIAKLIRSAFRKKGIKAGFEINDFELTHFEGVTRGTISFDFDLEDNELRELCNLFNETK